MSLAKLKKKTHIYSMFIVHFCSQITKLGYIRDFCLIQTSFVFLVSRKRVWMWCGYSHTCAHWDQRTTSGQASFFRNLLPCILRQGSLTGLEVAKRARLDDHRIHVSLPPCTMIITCHHVTFKTCSHRFDSSVFSLA